MSKLIVPRPYQVDIINSVRKELRHHRSVLVQSPTGSGKNTLAAMMVKGAIEKNNTALFAVHRKELLEQTVDTLRSVGIYPGIISKGKINDLGNPVQVATIQTLAGEVGQRVPPPVVLIIDEAHRSCGNQYTKLLDMWWMSKVVGLTATPCRLDGLGLGTHFHSMVNGPTVSWLIRNNFLSPYRAYAPANVVNTSGFSIKAGDYNTAEVDAAINKPSITGNVIYTWKTFADNTQTMVFCNSIAHSQAVAAEFISYGIPAVHVDGGTDDDIRRESMKDFRSGKVRVLCSVDLFTEGLDVPGVETVILLRPTASFSRFRQMVGRGLRYQLGKTAIFLDHVGNFNKHGLPDDHINWTLDGLPKRSRGDMEDNVVVRTCPICYGVSSVSAKICERCQIEFPKTPREIKQIEGELQEIKRIQEKRERGAARTLEDLIAIGVSKGYKNPTLWAHHVLNGRMRK